MSDTWEDSVEAINATNNDNGEGGNSNQEQQQLGSHVQYPGPEDNLEIEFSKTSILVLITL